MKPTQEIGQYDLLPAFAQQLLEADGTPADIVGKTVLLHVRAPGCPARVFVSTATVVDVGDASIQHDWAAAETQTPGVLEVWALATAIGVDPRAYPTWGFWTVRVLPRIG